MLEHPVFLASLDIEGQPAPERLVSTTNDVLVFFFVSLCLSLQVSKFTIKFLLRLVICLASSYGLVVVLPNPNMVYRVDLLDREELLLAVGVVDTVDITTKVLRLPLLAHTFTLKAPLVEAVNL